MQWSSKSIARLAAALAKAQAELVNPEKSLVATIYPDGAGEPGQAFRYASLASGLDIVRKTLSQHAIAAVQTTAIDEKADIVKLTTVLAHSSGEWIASDWPVCAVSETATPHRMGAALTYARRYALFTLVGIAGEDDLDAPDLQSPTTQTSVPQKPKGNGNGHFNSGRVAPRRDGKIHSSFAKPILGPDDSAELRDRLLVELHDLGSGDDAAIWAHRCLPRKNRLTATDAQRVEEAFQAKLADFGMPAGNVASESSKQTQEPLPPPDSHPRTPAKRGRYKGIDKSVLAVPEPRRVRDREHVKSVAKQPCLICGRQPADAHHLRFAQSRAIGRKVSDEFTVPLCRGHHREIHRCGDEVKWWKSAGIDPTVAARALWLETHPLLTTASVPVDPAERVEAGTVDRSW